MLFMKLHWINPISHYVYEGQLNFLNTFFNLYIYDEKYTNLIFSNHYDLTKFKKFTLRIKSNFLNIYSNPIKNKNDIKIIGDIFTNSLCYNFLFDKKTIFYTEFFNLPNESISRKIISKFILNLFRNKKFIVPTKQTYNTIKKYTSKLLYFPPLYVWNVTKEISNNKQLNILFVWNLGDWKKNIPLIFKIADYFKNNKHIKFTLIGWNKDTQKTLFNKYKYLTENGNVKIIDFISHNNLLKLYPKYDIFLFPSIIDPIGAVVLEAMASWLAIITNKNVWASSYVKNNINWFILDTNNEKEYISKIISLLENKNKLLSFKRESVNIIKQNHRFNNKTLINKKYQQFLNFINN